jgi:hypothetical protein
MQNSTRGVKQRMPNSVKNGVGCGQRKKFHKNGWMIVCKLYIYWYIFIGILFIGEKL